MNPQEPQQHDRPSTASQLAPIAPESHQKTRKRLALILIIGPTALFALAFIGAIVAKLVAGSAEPASSTDLFPQQSPLETIVNILFFLAGAIGILTWLPGLVIGIILLVKRSK
jgi:hypothetical protein